MDENDTAGATRPFHESKSSVTKSAKKAVDRNSDELIIVAGTSRSFPLCVWDRQGEGVVPPEYKTYSDDPLSSFPQHIRLTSLHLLRIFLLFLWFFFF
jgi:hypothetical protein